MNRRLAALRMLFDCLAMSQEQNPAHAVRGPNYLVKKGKTKILNREEAQALLSAIDASTLTGDRDRALIATMIYTVARISAVLQMNVRGYFVQDRRAWVRLHESGGKEDEAPYNHKLEKLVDDHIAAVGIANDLDGPL